jgi:hypothetical protein
MAQQIVRVSDGGFIRNRRQDAIVKLEGVRGPGLTLIFVPIQVPILTLLTKRIWE